MSLRNRVAALLVALSIVLVAIMYAAQELVVMPAFADLERTGADRNVSRCLESMERDLESISNMANDWASWDDSYQFVIDGNEKFSDSNLVDESFSNAHLNFICFVNRERKIVWGEVRDHATLALIDVPDLFAAITAAECPLTGHKEVTDSLSGVLVTSQGPMLVASRPIITTRHTGPIRGSLIMGRFLDADEIKSLADRTQVALTSWTIGQDELPPEALRILDSKSRPDTTHIETLNRNTLYAYRVVDDVYGKQAMVWRIDVPREITHQGRVAARVATAGSLVGGAATLMVMWILLQRGVVDPLSHLVEHVVHVGKSGNLKARLNLTRTDEIGKLANEFDQMAEHLSEYRKKVLDSAHRSGMEEVASEVLHNVGNAVNSAGCCVETLRDRLSESKTAGLERAVTLLRQQAPHAAEFFSNDPRGPKLLSYLGDVNDALHQEQSDQKQDIERLFDTIRHIRDVIAAQQTYTGQAEFRQEVDITDLVDEVLLLNHDQLIANRIQVAVDVSDVPDLVLNKSKTTQVLVNLVRNAIQAMEASCEPRVLSISAYVIENHGVEIDVADTGHGFDQESQTKLFAHGYTTKPKGNGFGLHYCANAVHAAGGHISATSPGPGQGAVFRVRLFEVAIAPQAALV